MTIKDARQEETEETEEEQVCISVESIFIFVSHCWAVKLWGR